jgi:hypothetical protein
VFTAAVGYLSKDLSAFETYVFKTEGQAWSDRVAGAVPTGTPGEFATVRTVVPPPLRSGDPDPRLGIGLDFIRFR